MNRDDIQQQVADLVARELQWSGPLPQGDLSEHLDSVQRLTLVVAIEDHFGLCFTPDDDQAVQTLDQVVDTILSRLPGADRG
jgi:acyl carrier protein